MTAILDAVDAGARGFSDPHWGDNAIAEMIPSPSPVGWDTDPDAAISAARDGWPAPHELTSQIERMLPHAAGYWHAADNLIGLLRTMPLTDQAAWACPGSTRSSRSRSKMPGMGTLAGSGMAPLAQRGTRRRRCGTAPVRRVVDTLAAEDYRGALELQRQGE